MGVEHGDGGEGLRNDKVHSFITPYYKYVAFRLAMGGTVGLLLSVLLCVDGIYQGFNLELWIFTAIFMSISILVTFFSLRWLFLHRQKGPENGGVEPPDSIPPSEQSQ